MIREAELADVPRLVEMGVSFMHESQYASHLSVDEASQGKLARMLIEAPHGMVFVSEQDGNLTGMIGVIATHHPHSGDKVMSELFWYVRPGARGHGVRLLRTAEDWARRNGIRKSITVAPNEDVEHLYTRLGYLPLERQFIKDL